MNECKRPAFSRALKGVLVLVMMVYGGISLNAQLISTRTPISAHAQILLHLDQLENTWEVQQARVMDERKGSAPGIGADKPMPGDLKLKLQLQMIQGQSMVFKLYPKVRDFIRMFSQQKRNSMEAVMGLAQSYFPDIEKQLRAAKLPLNLKYLPVALSAMNVHAVGEHGHAGPWQLNYHTATRYGLRCDPTIDERRDLVKSTGSAIAYLKRLHQKYGDWMLAIAAFSCGPGGVTKAQHRTGGSLDFETLYPHLPEYGRDYVPAFIAAVYVMTYHRLLGMEALMVPVPVDPDRIQLLEPVDFAPVAKVLGIPVQQLQALNPVCRTVRFPGDDAAVQLCLPRGFGNRFGRMKDSIFAMQARLNAPKPVLNPDDKVTPDKPSGDDAKGSGSASTDKETRLKSVDIPANSAKLIYTIKAGDNLGAISSWYDVPLSDLKGWNGLKNDYIRAGDRLYVYVAREKAGKLREVDQMTFDEKQVMIGAAPPPPKIPVEAGGVEAGKWEFYTVRKGDNLWQISQKYPGTSAEDIMQLNDITEDIKPGMRLKIRRKTK